jgi:putative transposase
VEQKRRAAGRTRHRSLRVSQRDEGLLPRIEALKAEHPFWGYQRIWAHWRFVEQLPINKRRVLRMMRAHCLLGTPNLRLKAERTPTRSKPKPTKRNEWWGINMTKVLVEDCGWVDVVVVLDWYTKVIVGYDAGIRCTVKHWLAALDMVLIRQLPLRVREQKLSLMCDNGSQPTSRAFIETCSPPGNASNVCQLQPSKRACRY